MRKHPYRCEGCKCYLDPGEGRFCEKCLEEREQSEKPKIMYKNIKAEKDGQYRMILAHAK